MHGGAYSPHMPRRGAPQAPQGPGSGDVFSEPPDTAKVERSLSTRELSHFRQVTELAPFELTIRSNVVPQSLHRYSKMGTLSSLSFSVLLVLNYIQDSGGRSTFCDPRYSD